LAFRNALLLYRALKAERHREVHLCAGGFDQFRANYTHFCLDVMKEPLKPKPVQAKEYANEILPGKLYLGDWHHASDAGLIETLGITHILNISDTCDNYLSESHP